jgi:hypothetical protein
MLVRQNRHKFIEPFHHLYSLERKKESPMLKKVFSLITACLLLASTSFTGIMVPSVSASTAQEDIISKTERAIKEAQSSALYDENGQVVNMTITGPNREKVLFGLSYDAQGQLKYLTQENGLKIEILYNQTGQFQGVALPDGGRMLINRKDNGEFGLTREMPGKKHLTFNRSRNNNSYGNTANFAGYIAEADCRSAVEAAGAAALLAAAACATSTLACIAAQVNLAFAIARAYRACNPEAQIEENVT